MKNTNQLVENPIHHTAAQIREFVKEIATTYMLDRPRRHGEERRSAERMSVTIPVGLTPLDGELRPIGYRCQTVSRDLSSLGVGLITSDPIAPTYAQLSFQPFSREAFEVICRVIYCKDLGYYFQVGCEFVISKTVERESSQES